jgi:hypothetical protein
MTHPPKTLVATEAHVFQVDPVGGGMTRGRGLERRLPSALAWDPGNAGRAWCGTTEDGVRWIDCPPSDLHRLWVAVEAEAWSPPRTAEGAGKIGERAAPGTPTSWPSLPC